MHCNSEVQHISVYDEYIIASSGILCSVLQGEKKKKRDPTFSDVTANLPFIFVGVHVLRTHWDDFQGNFL